MTNMNIILQRIGMSQRELAEKVGLSSGAISHYVTGIRRPNYVTAWNIVNVLNDFNARCTFEDVFPNPKSGRISK